MVVVAWLVFLISLQDSEVDFLGISFKIKSSVLMIEAMPHGGIDRISKRTRVWGPPGMRSPRSSCVGFLPAEVVGRGFCFTLFLWPTLLPAPGTAAGLPECSFSPSSGLMLSEKGPSPADGTTLRGTEGTRSFVTIRLPVRNQGDRISLCHLLTVSLTAIIHKKETFG